MSFTTTTPSTRLAAFLLASSILGCNSAITGNGDENEANEVPVTVLAIGSDYLDADDGIRYEVTAATKYEGYTGLSDVSVGELVDIEFEEILNSTNRLALEIEAPGADDG